MWRDLCKSFAVSVDQEGKAIGHLQFAKDGGEVVAYRHFADAQFFGYALVSIALDNGLYHVTLSLG